MRLKKRFRIGIISSVTLLVSSTLLPSGVAYAEERQLTQERERMETIRQEVAESLSDVATSTQVSEDNTVPASETRAMSSEEEVSVKAETVSDPLLPSSANTEASAEVSRQEETPEKVSPSEASDSEETSTPKRVKRSLAQSAPSAEETAPSSSEPLDFDSALERYHTQLNQEELLRFQNAKTNDEKSKIIEDILIRQINEDYGLLELEAFKEQLSEEQLQLLASKETDEAFEETLKSYYLAFQQEQDLAAFMDELILSSTEEEYDKLITAKSEREFTDTLLQLSEKKVQELSPVATEGSSRRKRFAPAAPFIVMYGPQIVSAAIATGKLLAVAASAIGTVYVGHRGIEAYKNYHQAKKSAKASKSSRVHRQSRSRTNAQSRSRAVNQAKQYARSSAGYSSAYTGNTGTYVPSYGSIRPSTPVVSYGPTAPYRSARAASNVFYYTGARTIPTYNLAGDKYTVIPNDSVWSISNQFGISMTDLITWNGIQHYTIHPGQQLLVRPTVLSADGKRHQVLPNDSVWSISHKYGIAMSDFIKWNNIKNNVIHPGQNLLIRPVASAKPVSPSQPASTTTSAKTYTVKAGDSVWLIAHNHGISMDNLVKWNNIKNYTIHPGQQVIVKPATTTKAPVNTGQASPAKTYTVKAGDSVWLIAHNHGISMDDLVKWNNIKNYTIHPGQQVVVKPASPAKAPTNTSQASSGSPAKTYTVKAGDSVWLIAHNHGISMDDLVKWNNIKNYTIHPGQQVVVKPASSAKAPTNTSQASSGSPAKTYTVKAGDSVWLIAHNHGISMDDLV
ncbi:LysM peptidoglycan-binding domain-containing protein, partial [Streptococcus pluranimalium]